MSDKNTPQYDPTSLAAWQENALMTVMVDENLGFKVNHIDILMWLSEDKGNPLMAAMRSSMQSGNNPLADLGEDEETLHNLTDVINKLLIEVVVSPPLTEQGNPPAESRSLKAILLDDKIKVFQTLIGGNSYEKMNKFRNGSPSNVVAAPEGE